MDVRYLNFRYVLYMGDGGLAQDCLNVLLTVTAHVSSFIYMV